MFDSLSAAVLALRVGLVATLAEAVRRGNVAASTNALVALALALSPSALAAVAPSARPGLELPLWIAAAGFLHSLGMLGLYESTSWWDHLTHTVSAALVAALLYAVALVNGASPVAATAATLAFTLAVGVLWELLELAARGVADRFGVEPVLVHYGRADTFYDLLFDLVGATVVVALDVQTFVPFVERVLRLVS